MWLFLFLACGSEPAPMFTCTDRAVLHDVTPLSGGRAVWCERANGTRHGPFREFRADGSRFKDGQYHNNRKTGVWTLYHPDGTKLEEATYELGKLHGWKLTWDAAGVETSRQEFREGDAVE